MTPFAYLDDAVKDQVKQASIGKLIGKALGKGVGKSMGKPLAKKAPVVMPLKKSPVGGMAARPPIRSAAAASPILDNLSRTGGKSIGGVSYKNLPKIGLLGATGGVAGGVGIASMATE